MERRLRFSKKQGLLLVISLLILLAGIAAAARWFARPARPAAIFVCEERAVGSL